MINRFFTYIATLLYTSETIIERKLGWLTFLWGAWLFNPWINTFDAGRGYDVMRNICPYEWIWGAIIMIVGLKMRWGYYKGAKQRRDSLFGLLIVWTFIAVMIVSANWTSTGTVVYPMIVYTTLRCYFIADQQYKSER